MGQIDLFECDATNIYAIGALKNTLFIYISFQENAILKTGCSHQTEERETKKLQNNTAPNLRPSSRLSTKHVTSTLSLTSNLLGTSF